LNPTILFVPGLRDHVAEHWQTLLAAEIPGARTVAPLTHDKLSCAARVAALDAAIAAIDGPVVLFAHSAGCLMVVHWAQQADTSRVQAALLATPADIETALPAGYPTMDELQSGGWLPLPRTRLPFPTVVAASRNDPLAKYDRLETLAQDWRAAFVDLGEVGHLNPASGFGPWPQGRTLVDALCREIVV
jgi:predicted alpha/beta hydrolase family esterase